MIRSLVISQRQLERGNRSFASYRLNTDLQGARPIFIRTRRPMSQLIQGLFCLCRCREESVREDMAFAATVTADSADVEISGAVYDVDTGRMTVVEE